MKKTLQAVVLLCLPLGAPADEGLWTLDNFPWAMGGMNTAIMLEALETVYGANHLLDELTLVE